MKLELGSGKKPHRGFTTVDIEPDSHPGIVGDFRTMTFENVEEIHAHHLLEHFGREEGLNVLKLWHGWLKPGGILIVETPDFEEICREFYKDPYWMTRHAYGSQEAEWAYHRDGWFEAKFLEELPKLGFQVTQIEKRVSRRILPNIVCFAKKV